MATEAQAETNARLTDTIIDGDVTDLTVAQALGLILRQIAPDIPIHVKQTSLLADPAITRGIFPALPLRDAIATLAEAAGAKAEVDESGALVIRPAKPEEILARQRSIAMGDFDIEGIDRDGIPFRAGDRVAVAHQDDPMLLWLLGLVGVVTLIERSSVVLTLNHPQASSLSTFQAWVRKVDRGVSNGRQGTGA